MSASTPSALLLSPHPLALEALRAALVPLGVPVLGVRLPHSAHPDLSLLEATPGDLVVIDACYPPVGAERVVALVMGTVPGVRALVLTDILRVTPLCPLRRKIEVTSLADVRSSLVGCAGAIRARAGESAG